VGIYVSTIRRIEFRKSWSQIANGGHYGYLLFYQRRIYVSFYHEGIHYCTTHKYSTETLINASRLT